MPDIGDVISAQDQQPEVMAGSFKPREVTSSQEKDYLSKIKKRNKYLLQDITDEEAQRIADYVIAKYNEALPAHEELCLKIDEWDEVSRLIRKEVIGSTGDLPNYRLPFSLVAHEVIHANILNVFFSPKDIMRVIPVSADDISKVNNVSTFGNWSLKNELDIFNKVDQLFHGSEKAGESVAMIYWKKEYGIEIKREPIRGADGQVVYDEETKDPVYHEIEEPKLIYNAPWMDVLSRKDYIQPPECRMGEVPEYEGRILRLSYDQCLREELQAKFRSDVTRDIKDWGSVTQKSVESQTIDGESESVPKWSKEFIEMYIRMRINLIKQEATDEEQIEAYELEDEFIVTVHIKTRKLCALRKNRFPLKMRPFIVDYFIPDDTGRRSALGIYELMDSLQKAYDTLFNQFIYSVELSNNPIVFFTPTGNMRAEKMKLQKGFMYPTSDANSVKIFDFPGPNDSLQYALQLIQQWGQFLFGISDYAAGMESTIDPSAPAKKAQIIVEQGNVRLNLIIKRKLDTLKQIFKMWYLLYRDNMPANKFMRISGEGEGDNPWKFEAISYEDFALQSIPDFELTGNVLNANKQLEANKAIAIYQMMATNYFFNPQTPQGLQALRSLTKWLIDKMDDAGLSRFLPQVQNEGILYTPEEENAVMVKGNKVIVIPSDDDIHHIKSHGEFINSPTVPEEIKPLVGQHIKEHIQSMQMKMQQSAATHNMGAMQSPMMGAPGMQPMPNNPNGGMPINNQGGQNALTGGFGASGTPGAVLPG